MRYLYICYFFLPLVLNAQAPENSKVTEAEIVRTDDFSVRRFQEVVSAALKAPSKTLREDLISLRAKLILAERRWNELKDVRPTDTPSEADTRDLSRAQLLRASQAKMNHYQAKISRLEDQILKERRKAQEDSRKPSPKKKK